MRERLSQRKATVPGIALLALLAAATVLSMVGYGPLPGRSHHLAPTHVGGEVSRADARARPTAEKVPGRGAADSTTLSGTGPGALPQTGQFPSSGTPAFFSEMAALWQGIKAASLPAALPAFFPEAAYLQIKTLAAPRTDYIDRLLVQFQLDIGAAHRILGRGAASATLVRVSVPNEQARWISPGECFNKIGYFQVSGSRLVYEVRGRIRSFGIASLISWRGVWYVVHLGAILRSGDTGIVDDPSSGPGAFGSPEGC